MSLGLGLSVAPVQTEYPSFRFDPGTTQYPTGGYLGRMLATSTPKELGQKALAASTSRVEAVESTLAGDATVPTVQVAGAAGDPDNGSSDSSSSDSDNDSDYRRMSNEEKSAYKKGKKKVAEARATARAAEKAAEKAQREKIEKLKLIGYRTKLPMQYDGTPDIEIYEQWHFEMRTFIEDTGLSPEEGVKHSKSFVKGVAAVFFMCHIAMKTKEYTFETFAKALFAHCFLPNVLDQFRHLFHTLRQRDKTFRDYVRELQRYQTWLEDIDDQQVARRAWAGAKKYLRVEWAKNGISPEKYPLEVIEESGPSTKATYGSNNRNRSYGQGSSNQKNRLKPKQFRPKLTDRQLEEYQAAGKCFLCGEVGHSKRDCPKRNSAKPTGLSSSSINYAAIEALEVKRSELSLSAVDFNAEEPIVEDDAEADNEWEDIEDVCATYLELNAARTKKSEGKLEIERNSAIPKDLERRTSAALIAEMFVNGKSCRVLLDSGSLGNFISTTIVDQLRLKPEILAKPIGLNMAVSGSKSQIKHSVEVNIKYQDIDGTYRLDIANLDWYDLILGTPFLHTHSIALAFNPHAVLVQSVKPLPLTGPHVRTIEACATELYEEKLDEIRQILYKESEDICKQAADTPLPPLRAINHRIPIIDENKTYSWRSSRCPDALRGQWEKKLKAYLDTGRWEFVTGKNAIPMLLIPKKGTEGESMLRTVLDKQEQNANTYKVASPLPDIQEILWKVSQYKYRTLIDGKDAYKQIRVEPEDVHKTIFSTPSGTMISRVMQIGDTNATATYQSIMNHLFAHAIGVYMHVFLDDIVIFTNTLEEHVRRVREVFDVLRRKKFFLSPKKMQFLAEKLNILGHIVDSKGIQMDPHKVESVLSWKVPDTKEQLMSFLGAVGYLAPNCAGIRIPMGLLTSRASIHKHWNWDATAQRAFDEVKEIVSKWRDHHRVAIDYSEGAPPINLVTDASLTGASGILSQGEDPKTAKIAMFWSGKFTPTQQNYPVHELELYAIKELLEKFKYQLYRVHFRIYTDNKSLVHLMTQKNLSPRQARWLEAINEFNFTIIHIAGEENKVADTLSRMYVDEPEGMVRAKSEYLKEDEDSEERMQLAEVHYDERAPLTCPLYIGNAVVLPEDPNKEAEALGEELGEVSEGVSAKEADKAEEAPERTEPVLWRSGRERKQVAKYVQPPQVPRKPRAAKPNVKALEGYTDNEAIVEPQAESEAKDNKKEEVSAGGNVHTHKERERTRIYYDTSPTLLDKIKDKYESNNLFAKVLKNPSQFKNFELIDGIIYIKQNSGKAVCVPNVDVNGRRAREEAIRSTHDMLRHAGTRKTLYGMRGRVWWDSMVSNVKEYWLLTPLKRPEIPWERISIDFVGPLPESENILGKWDMIILGPLAQVYVDDILSDLEREPTLATSPSQIPDGSGDLWNILTRRVEDSDPKTRRLDAAHRGLVDASTSEETYEPPQATATHQARDQAKIRRRYRRIKNRR
ncbi:Transposon Ty3-I Gag-Pol polyprotein [Ceratobasidium sp. AG-Ba]|nr:Transposon Ty3-I Gag-Pol polyprotein [Ceratobasidium sp. AG-Ba]